MSFEPIVIPIRPVFVTPSVQPITEIEVPFPVEPFGEYIEPTEAVLEALAARIIAFDPLNDVVLRRIIHHLFLFNRYEPGYLNRHSVDYCLALAVQCSNTCRDLRGKDFSEWVRWMKFIEHADPDIPRYLATFEQGKEVKAGAE